MDNLLTEIIHWAVVLFRIHWIIFVTSVQDAGIFTCLCLRAVYLRGLTGERVTLGWISGQEIIKLYMDKHGETMMVRFWRDLVIINRSVPACSRPLNVWRGKLLLVTLFPMVNPFGF